MATNLESVLGYVNLTGIIQSTVSGVPDILPAAFRTITRDVIGDAGRYTQVTGNRQTARLAMYGSPAHRRALRDVAERDVKLLHTFEEISIKPLVFQQLRNYTDYNVQRLGMAEIARQTLEFQKYFTNLEISAILSMLFLGAIYFDGDGNLLPTSAGAFFTVDFGVPANNKNQLNGLISASWAAVATDIPLQIRNIRKTARRLTGYPLKLAFYGENIPSYMSQNDFVLDYMARNPNFNREYLDAGEIPNGLFGLTWIPAYETFFEDQNNVNQTFVGADSVAFTPEIDETVYEMLHGSFLVPTSFNAVNDLAAAMNTLVQVFGMGSYALPMGNPPSVNQYMFNTFLPVWKVPASMFIADVTP